MFSQETEDLIKQGWAVREANFARDIYFDYPTHTESISLTGTACSLDCAHCGGHYLKGMKNVAALSAAGAAVPKSFLISGGCTADGKVPFLPHTAMLRQAKSQARLNFHVGLVGDEELAALKELADVVSFDFVADTETIQEVYGLQKTAEDYQKAYLRLRKQVKVLPHVTLGLKGGEWRGEEKALACLEELGLDGLAFLVFIPTPGTRYADRRPPAVEEVITFLAKARLRFPTIPLILGCMRPKGQYRRILDEAAVALGLNRIVLPTPGARALAEKRGLKAVKGEECCAL